MQIKPKYILGIKPDGTYRDSLSYSGWNLWKTSKDSYRRRYYENERPFETVETIFGKHIGQLLEDDHESLKHIIRYDTPELTLEVNIDGAKFNGRLDTFDSKTFAFLDYKTGHLDKQGKIPWDKVKVAKLKQLDWYSWLIEEEYGKVKNLCHIVWLETEFKSKTMEFQGHTLEAQVRELQLTGKMKKIPRTIQGWQRKKIKEEALLAVKEIDNDYKEYKRIKSGETLA